MEVTANYLFMGPKDCRERITELQFAHWQWLTSVKPEEAHLLRQELQALLDKGAI